MSVHRGFRVFSSVFFIAVAQVGCTASDDKINRSQTAVPGDNEGSENTTDEATDTDTGSDAAEPEVALVIDDFEDGDHVSFTGGSWYIYDDNLDEGRSTITISQDDDGNLIMDGEGYQSQSALSLSYSLDQGDWIWEPYVGWFVAMGEEDAPYDASAYSGLTYAYKGSAHFVYVYTFDVTNYDYYRVYIPYSEEWQVVYLLFSEFSQGGWDGISVPFNLDNVKQIGWEYKGATGDTGSILVDNVGFLGGEALESDTDMDREPDLTIHEPDPPEDDTLDTIDIPNPVQALVYESLGRGYALSNWLEARKFESYDYDDEYIQLLADNGFDSVRLPIDLDFYIEKRGDYLEGDAPFAVESTLFEILDSYESWTAEAGLGLVIDYHQYDQSLDLSDPGSVATVVQLWTAVADHFADNPREDLFFEILNEPELSCGVDAVSPSDWTAVASQIIDGIRSADTTRVILFGDVEWNNIGPLIERTPFDDERMAYVFHFYEPFIFTHQGTTSTGMHTTKNIPYPYSADRWSEYSSEFGFGPDQADWQWEQLESYHHIGTKSWMRNRIIEVKRWSVEHNVPVVCTEFGVNTGAGAEDTVNYYTDLADVFDELEIPWQIWFKIMDQGGDIDPDIRSALNMDEV